MNVFQSFKMLMWGLCRGSAVNTERIYARNHHCTPFSFSKKDRTVTIKSHPNCRNLGQFFQSYLFFLRLQQTLNLISSTPVGFPALISPSIALLPTTNSILPNSERFTGYQTQARLDIVQCQTSYMNFLFLLWKKYDIKTAKGFQYELLGGHTSESASDHQ